MHTMYYIGGSPCSGKSTITEVLSEKWDLEYFKIDDALEKYTTLGASEGKSICMKHKQMSTQEIWMRDPSIQVEEELLFYDEIAEYIMDDIASLSTTKKIIAEGAAFKPDIMKKIGVLEHNYLCIVPTREFQIDMYKQREWMHYVIGECSDPEQAFMNWMERDVQFTLKVKAMCNRFGYTCLVNDGTQSIEALIQEVATHFHMED